MRKLLLILVLILPIPLMIIPVEAATQTAQKPPKIRVLIFKHSREYIADHDAELVLQAIKHGESQGLDVHSIGAYYFTEPVKGMVSDDPFTNILMEPVEEKRFQRFQDFISDNIKKDKSQRDNVIVFSVGHGSPSGYLHNIGQRTNVFKALAAAAAENKQPMLWWQLSCYASAGLPSLSSLPPEQQKYFNMVASSDSRQSSYIDIQGKIMDRLFTAMVNDKVDTNHNGVIEANELDAFFRLPGSLRDGGGPIVYSLKPDSIFFGFKGLGIPILDRIGTQGIYNEEYVPIP
jgi:hypothetical protein